MRNKQILGLLLFVFSTSLAFGQTEQAAKPDISVVGRLTLEKRAQEERLTLHAKSAQTYVIIGNLREKLKNALIELGQNNLVSLAGKQDIKRRIFCEKTSQYKYNKKGETILETAMQCIPYYNLEVAQIFYTKQSEEEIPPPKRDGETEKRMMATSKERGQSTIPVIYGEIYGTVSSINLKSPIKTIEIINRDKDNPLKKIILIMSGNTRIAKKIGNQEPMALSEKALVAGQEITAVYLRGEFKTEALFITITKE